MQIPFMYHYANRPGLSTQRSRQVIIDYFNTSVSGIPGNDGKLLCHPLHVGLVLIIGRFWYVVPTFRLQAPA